MAAGYSDLFCSLLSKYRTIFACNSILRKYSNSTSINNSVRGISSVIGYELLMTVPNNIHLRRTVPNLNIVLYRSKYTKKRSGDLTDSDDEDDEITEKKLDSDAKNSGLVNLKVNSLRTDLILKAGLGIARNKVEALFYDSKIRVNGRKIFKKSSMLNIGDEVDIIRGPSPMNPNFILVSRVEIISSRENSEGTVSVQLRRFKSITVENYDES